jgi:hypothetical protein
MTPARPLSVVQEPALSPSPESGVDPRGDNLEGALLSLMAMGAPLWEALATLREGGLDPLAVPPHWNDPAAHLWVPDREAIWKAMDFLRKLGKTDPVAANEVLGALLRNARLGKRLAHPPDLSLGHLPWLTSIPEGLEVGGDLDLRQTGITALPHGAMVGGNLWLDGQPIVTMAGAWEVKGYAYLRKTPIFSLPEGLRVGYDLDLDGCRRLTTLPEGLHVGGILKLHQCDAITRLADGLSASQLDLGWTKITTLPRRLVVHDRLYLTSCSTWDGCIPEDAYVGNELSTAAHPMGIKLSAWRHLHPHGERA